MSVADAAERLQYTATELLGDLDYKEPLFANGVRCHGGFDADGNYRSPRTRFRNPAVGAWQARLRREGNSLIELPDGRVSSGVVVPQRSAGGHCGCNWKWVGR